MDRRPNIVLIVTDQQRRDTVGAYGSEICQTPSIDRLAEEGMRFDRAFTPTGLCSPVRCSLLTGVYPHEHRVLTNVGLHPVRAELAPEDDQLSKALKRAGYQLGCIGKWHVSSKEPPEFGYDRYISLGDFLTWRSEIGRPAHDALMHYTTQIADFDPQPAEFSRPRFLADNAVQVLNDFQKNRDPFFVRLDFHGPHFPNVVPEPYYSMYDPDDIPPWPNYTDDLSGKPAVQRIKQRHWRTEGLHWKDWAPLVSAYWGEISLIDDAIGHVLGHLDHLSLSDNTLVIFTSDHGDTIGAHGICNKDYTMYEEIYHVPLVIRWPGVVRAGTSSTAFVHHFLDLFATISELTEHSLPYPCHGRSLIPILSTGQEPADWPQSAYCEFHGSHMGLYSMRLLTTEQFAYIYHTNDIDELYDRSIDPWQLNNVAEDPDYALHLSALKRQMIAWMSDSGDHLHNEWTVDWLSDGDQELMAAAPGRRRTKW
ncbi:MAG: sulfatase-like hydrolase/transferase [Hyphomicrobiaceae bacterium]